VHLVWHKITSIGIVTLTSLANLPMTFAISKTNGHRKQKSMAALNAID
jgi:hypothetical protein